MDSQTYLGCYYNLGYLFIVKEDGSEIAIAIQGVPAGYEIGLIHLEGDRFRMRGGPADGATVQFNRAEDGALTEMSMGDFSLPKISPEKAASLPVITRLTAPPVSFTPQKITAFQALLDAVLKDPTGAEIKYELPYPKHEFVQFVMAKDVVIFHGSNNPAIEIFQPVRTSVELYDRRGAGNLQAIYGTQDGLWSMFFAVVNRKQLKGSIRNGVMTMHNRDGVQLAVYNFSINQEQLAERPWTAGALYFLPRLSFVRQKFIEDSYSNEWACHTPVKPLARLLLKPEDFPFLDQIGGHDDSVLIRADALAKTVRDAALAANLEGARFCVTVPDRPEMAQTLADLIEIQRVLIPTAQFEVESQVAGLKMTIDHLPPAYQQVFGKAYQELIEAHRSR